MINKVIGPYKSSIILKEHNLTIVLSKEDNDSELFAIVTDYHIQHELKGIVGSLIELSKLMEDINQEEMSVKDGRIFFILTVNGKERSFSF